MDAAGIVHRLDGTVVTRPPHPARQAGEGALRLLRRIGGVDPTSLRDYRAHGGYSALPRAFQMGAEAVIGEPGSAPTQLTLVRIPSEHGP